MASTPFSAAGSGIGLLFGSLMHATVHNHCTGAVLLFEALQYKPLDDGHSEIVLLSCPLHYRLAIVYDTSQAMPSGVL